MARLTELLYQAFSLKASDLHLTVGVPPTFRLDGRLVPPGSGGILSPPTTTLALAQEIMTPRQSGRNISGWESLISLIRCQTRAI